MHQPPHFVPLLFVSPDKYQEYLEYFGVWQMLCEKHPELAEQLAAPLDPDLLNGDLALFFHAPNNYDPTPAKYMRPDPPEPLPPGSNFYGYCSKVEGLLVNENGKLVPAKEVLQPGEKDEQKSE